MITVLDDIPAELAGGTLLEHLHTNLELKEEWSPKHGAKLSALANKAIDDHGWLVIGVTDGGKPAGKSEGWAKKTEEIVSQQINEELDPLQACGRVACLNVGKAWIVCVCVKNPGEVVYWADAAYAGAGTTIRQMSASDIMRLRLKLPGLVDFSKQKALSEYDEDLVGKFGDAVVAAGDTAAVSSRSKTAVLNRLNMSDKQVARILFGDCAYRVVFYDRNGDPVSNKTHRGLYRLLTADFAAAVQEWTAQELGVESEPYPARALKEGLANAVAHAAYFESDGNIIVELHPDRLSVSNLCLRESAAFANRWFSRAHKTVNGLLMEVLRLSGAVDELGRGKSIIFGESIKNGKHTPEVVIEKSGRYDRWKLTMFGGMRDPKLVRVLERCRERLGDEPKALLATALVLWRDKPVSEIKQYLDGDYTRQFAEVVADARGPVLYYENGDALFLNRWAGVLLDEGKNSKALSPEEEKRLCILALKVRTQFHGGAITPLALRELAGMGNTPSELSQSSNVLARWCVAGLLERVGRGKYRFCVAPDALDEDAPDLARLFAASPSLPTPQTPTFQGAT